MIDESLWKDCDKRSHKTSFYNVRTRRLNTIELTFGMITKDWNQEERNDIDTTLQTPNGATHLKLG